MITAFSKTRKLVSILLTAGLCIFNAQQVTAQCKSVTENISTGIDDNGNILPAGTADPHWTNTQGASNVISPYSGWSTMSGSAWLGLSYGSSNTDYYYTRTFNAIAAGTINFQSLADNYVTIYLDGVQITQTPGLSIYGFQTAHSANYSGSFGFGSHTIQAVVHNESIATGFNLSGSVTYIFTPVSIDISTGTSGGSILPSGSVDPNWQNTSYGYNVVTSYSSWDNLSGSAWLGNTNYTSAGNFYFTRNFTTTSGGTISFEALADNYVNIYLDGSFLAQTPGSSAYGFQLANKVTYSGSVTAGSHTITADVYNYGGPIGFNLSGKVTYCDNGETPKCEIDPSFTAYYVSYNTAGFNSSTSSVNIPGPNEVIYHDWTFGDGGTSTATNPVYTYGAPGSYTVTHTIVKYIYDAKGNLLAACKLTKTCKLTITNGFIIEPIDAASRPPIDGGSVTLDCKDVIIAAKQSQNTSVPVQKTNEATVYPNPAVDKLYFTANGGSLSVQVIAVDGRTVINRTDVPGNATLDISSLTPGSYIIRVNQDGNTKNLHFTKVQ